jgi:hypothetical protein
VQLDIRSLLLGFMAGSAVILSVAFYLVHLAERWSTESDDAGFERSENLEGLLPAGQLSGSAEHEVVASWLFPPADSRPSADHAKPLQS